MLWIGLTGGIGTGKSTVSGLLKELGYPVIDADRVAHRALVQGSPTLPKIIEIFGNGILNPDGDVDRKVLGKVVFGNKEKLLRLESIVHPFVQAEVKKERAGLAAKKHTWAFYDVPLLYEKQLESQFDAIIVVAAEPLLQRERLQKRGGLSDADIQARMAAQMPIAEKSKKTKYVILNNGSREDLKTAVKQVLFQLPRPRVTDRE